MEMKETAMMIGKKLSDRKARDVLVTDISEKSSFADYFVNATAGSERQLDALATDAQDAAAEAGLEIKGVEGRGNSGWMLIDLGDIIVNMFTEENREKYAVDKIWSDCPSVEIQ